MSMKNISMKNISMKNMIYSFTILFIVVLIIASFYSFHLGFGFMLSTIILGLLFYYNVKLGVIALFIIVGLFLYVRFFPKEKEKQKNKAQKNKKKYTMIKEPDNLEHEYDYKVGDVDEYSYSYINDDIETQVIEGMSNKKRNTGIDRIAAETALCSKDSNILPISGPFGVTYKEPVSVGGEGTMSGYELIQE